MSSFSSFESLPALCTVIEAHGLAAKKSLGQHFLTDRSLLERIARTAGDLKNFHIIEIGPGPGGLTRALLEAGAKQVTAIEKDQRCLAALADIKKIAGKRLEIIEADALKIDIAALAPAPRKIVANLPYNIATELLFQWIEVIYNDSSAFASLTLMFQKEVARRIAAPPGGKEYGRLSVMSQWLCEARLEFELPPGAFSPPPKVHSAVVTLVPRSKPLAAAKKEILERVVATAFNQRRKMLRQALKSLGGEKLLKEAGIDPTLRAEQLDIEQFCALAVGT